MFSALMSHAYGLFSRSAPALLALQDAARPSGGAHSPAPQAGQGGGGPGGMLTSLAFPLLIAVFLYFMMIRPMSKQRKEQEGIQKSLQKGDKVVTSSGIVGTVSGIDDQFVTLEISERVRVKFLRDAISRKLDAGGSVAKTSSSERPPTATTTPVDVKK